MATAVRGAAHDRVVELLQTADELDERQFESLYRHYVDQLCRFAAARGAADPEGVANLALFDAYRAFGRRPIRDEPAFRQYLYRATANRAIGEHRRSHPEADQLADDVLVADDPTHDVVTKHWLADLVDELPDAQKAVIHDRFYADLTVTEAADRLGRSDGAVHQLQHRAVDRLRRLALAGVAVVLIGGLVAVAVWQAASGGGSQIDTGPIDAPAPTPTPTVATTSPPTSVVETSAVTAEAEASSVTVTVTTPPADEPLTAETAEEATATTAQTTPESSAGPDADTAAFGQVGNGSKPDSDQATSTIVPAPAGLLGSTVVNSGAAVSAGHAEVAQPATAANTCIYWNVIKTGLRIQLFDPAGDQAAAEGYQAPAMVRFVASDGSTKVLDISTGSIGEQWQAQATGWLEAGGFGTPDDDYTGEPTIGWTAAFATYPLDDVVSIQYLHLDAGGEALWASAPSCAAFGTAG